MNTWTCRRCAKGFQPRGIGAHMAMHRRKQDGIVEVSVSDGRWYAYYCQTTDLPTGKML